VNEEYVEKVGALWDQTDKDGIEFVKSKGGKLLPLSNEEDARWAKAVRPLLDEYVKDTKTKGLPGDQALKFCLDFIKANQK